jgi:hypothetical protein
MDRSTCPPIVKLRNCLSQLLSDICCCLHSLYLADRHDVSPTSSCHRGAGCVSTSAAALAAASHSWHRCATGPHSDHWIGLEGRVADVAGHGDDHRLAKGEEERAGRLQALWGVVQRSVGYGYGYGYSPTKSTPHKTVPYLGVGKHPADSEECEQDDEDHTLRWRTIGKHLDSGVWPVATGRVLSDRAERGYSTVHSGTAWTTSTWAQAKMRP